MQLRQTWTLIRKDLLLIFSRKSSWSTVFRAGFIPIVIAVYLAIIFRIYFPDAQYGVGSPTPIRSLSDAMALGGSRTLVLLNNASSVGGEIDRIINFIADPLRSAGKPVIITNSSEELRAACRPSLQGATKCFAGAVFHSSPSEGPDGLWNYTLRGDASFGLNRLDVFKTTNDGEIYIFPLQHAIDSAIASISGNGTALPSTVDEYLFTSQTDEQFKSTQRLRLLQSNINFASVVWILTIIGVTFQLVTLMAKERETEMSDLIECMMPNKRRWEPQAIRLLARHIAFDITYFPSWIIIALFFKAGYYKSSNVGIPIVGLILAGLAFVSFSILGASFFKRAQLSSITVVGIAIVLGIVTQITSKRMSSVAVGVTGFLFTPMAFVNYLITCARFENGNQAISLTQSAPKSPWDIPPMVFWIFFIVQIIMYPIMAIFVERWLYGTAASRVHRTTSKPEYPIVVKNCSKIYQHSWLWNKILQLFGKKTKPVAAVKDVSLSALNGQVTVLVGANGCGKSTILNGIVGLGSMTSGSVTVDGTSGIGLCPQKNILWNALTVEQHAKIFNRLKTADGSQVGSDLQQLFKTCGLEGKLKTPSKNLSGGQKRKLQLLMMLTGGSSVCCVDEASGGLDPLSRRKIWDVLLAERGSRTVVLTTHFLDEAEFLADNMIIMHQAQIKATGSVSELKTKLGNGYRIHIVRGSEKTVSGQPEIFEDLETVVTASEALARVKQLESRGITNYQIAGPTIEEVFMNLAADRDAAYEEDDFDLHSSASRSRTPNDNSKDSKDFYTTENTLPSRQTVERKKVGAFRQLQILFAKRFTVFTRNPAPLLITLFVPFVAAGLISILIKGVKNPSCSLNGQFSSASTTTLSSNVSPQLLVGPVSAFSSTNLGLLGGILPSGNIGPTDQNKTLLNSVHLVNSFPEFYDFTESNFSTINPGGIYLGDSSAPPTFTVRSDVGIVAIYSGVLLQNALDVLLTGVRIATQYTIFDYAFPSATDETIQFVFYFGLVMAAYPAFFTLYICQERLRGVKAMEFSNGVRPFPLWAAYTLFDWIITFFSTVIITIIFVTATSSAWYGIGYLFVVLLFYGLAAVLLSYIISSFAKSQFAAFAFSAGGQCIMLLIYMTAYISIQAQSDPDKVPHLLNIAHYTISCISPISQLVRSLLLGLNLFSILCQGQPPVKRNDPGSWDLFGGPIFFLIIQSLLMFLFLVWKDHRYSFGGLKKKRQASLTDVESVQAIEREVLEEEARVETSDDGLRVVHVDKAFKSFGHGNVHAVKDLTFGVKRGEVFALVGVNGAGKSTTISMLRGELSPTGSRGDLFIQDVSVLKDRYLARFHLGVCPQFDAMDKMSVFEHLSFYARVRGVRDVAQTVEHMIRSVGLQPFADRMAEKLSGGNKRKLSLGMALIGNPEVVLLDEPSSGMDPLAKRSMWKTLVKFRPGRSILLTTHSMEEADALASRVGVISKRLLDIGTTDHLRSKHGHGFHLHLVQTNAPHTSTKEMETLQHWIEKIIPRARLEGFPYHGQMRFIISSQSENHSNDLSLQTAELNLGAKKEISVVSLFTLLEENKDELGLEFYTVSPSTFDEIFLKIVEKHDIQEEQGKRTRKNRHLLKKLIPFARN